MAIVMGLDRHRAHITAEWIDTDTGKVSHTRISPAHRAGVRRFAQQLGGRELEAALEVTTGWRFVVEELRRVGAVVHLAEPAETAGRRSNKQRAKSDRADARHLREVVDDRAVAGVADPAPITSSVCVHGCGCATRCRISALNGSSGSSRCSPGCPQRSNLMTREGLSWLAAQPLPAAAREQITIALSMIDALERQLAPLDKELHA